jgi:tRNA pseudouridine38-40 synthase
MTIDSPIPTENLAKAINGRLPNNIAILEAVEVPEAFDVISDVTTKLYRYTICTAKIRPVLQVNHCWHHPYNLDISMMAEAAQKLVGTHDFKSFASAADTRENSVRTIFRCDISAENDWIFVDVEGDGFLYNMVRNIVGTLAEAGAGRITPDDITLILDAKNRTAAGPIAPPQGLCLRWIKY